MREAQLSRAVKAKKQEGTFRPVGSDIVHLALHRLHTRQSCLFAPKVSNLDLVVQSHTTYRWSRGE